MYKNTVYLIDLNLSFSRANFEHSNHPLIITQIQHYSNDLINHNHDPISKHSNNDYNIAHITPQYMNSSFISKKIRNYTYIYLHMYLHSPQNTLLLDWRLRSLENSLWSQEKENEMRKTGFVASVNPIKIWFYKNWSFKNKNSNNKHLISAFTHVSPQLG